MHKSRMLDLLPDNEPAAESATEETTDGKWQLGRASSSLEDGEGFLLILVDVLVDVVTGLCRAGSRSSAHSQCTCTSTQTQWHTRHCFSLPPEITAGD